MSISIFILRTTTVITTHTDTIITMEGNTHRHMLTNLGTPVPTPTTPPTLQCHPLLHQIRGTIHFITGSLCKSLLECFQQKSKEDEDELPRRSLSTLVLFLGATKPIQSHLT